MQHAPCLGDSSMNLGWTIGRFLGVGFEYEPEVPVGHDVPFFSVTRPATVARPVVICIYRFIGGMASLRRYRIGILSGRS